MQSDRGLSGRRVNTQLSSNGGESLLLLQKERDFEGLKGFLHTSSTTTRVSGRKRKKKKLAWVPTLYYYVRIQYGYYIYKHWSAPLHLEQRLLYYLVVMNLLYYYHVCIYVRVPKLIHLCKCKYRKCNTYDTTKYWLLTATKCNLSYVMQYRVVPRHRKHKACSVILSNVFAGYIFSGIHLDWNLLWRIKE